MIVNPDFIYTTRLGDYAVTFYTHQAVSHYNIHGSIRVNGRDVPMSWDADGRADPVYSMTEGREWDLKKVKYNPKKEKAVIILSKYPMPLPMRILEKFSGKRVRISLEEV